MFSEAEQQQEVARYLQEIVPPVLACFSDQDARVRYYACESMYNIAKVAKGEILIYFNDVFDALSKLAADTELSVKNGAELLDRLVKDIVSESAATYASVLTPMPGQALDSSDNPSPDQSIEIPTAFSLPRFIPLLQERINVQNPFARTFLVSWITLLDQIPDLELVAYLPSFLGGLLKFLSDSNEDVHTATKVALQRFLVEIKKIAEVKRGIAESRKSRDEAGKEAASLNQGDSDGEAGGNADESRENRENGLVRESSTESKEDTLDDDTAAETSSVTVADEDDQSGLDDEWIPGQDVHIDYEKILNILIDFLSSSREEEVQVTALNWIEAFLDICPEDILLFTPRLLEQLLPALSHHKEHVSSAAHGVNQLLMRYIMSLPEDPARGNGGSTETSVVPSGQIQSNIPISRPPRDPTTSEKRESIGPPKYKPGSLEDTASRASQVATPEPAAENGEIVEASHDLDYEAAVSALTLQFLHEREATRVAALAWLIMLHRKSPRKILAIQDATFPALLKTLSDPAEAVVTRDLLLLSQISKSSDDSYFSSFMVNLLKLFCTDRRLLETRGNLIIRQLCLSLSAERIYRTMADCLEKDNEDDIEFASIMVQNLNNNLITAPELADLRKRLRSLDSRDGQTFFTAIFRAWCVNAVATFSLCLLAQAYEQAYNLLQIFCDIEMSVTMLIQIDKLVQLLESPVFTYLRMQLLEPERYPYLYKCLYGILMLLPQSSAFAALKNRLNSVSAIGYLHTGIATRTAAPGAPGSGVGSGTGAFGERQGRLKSRDDSSIKWNELLEKFRQTQDRVRRSQQRQLLAQHGLEDTHDSGAADFPGDDGSGRPRGRDEQSRAPGNAGRLTLNVPSASQAGSAGGVQPQHLLQPGQIKEKGKSALGNSLGRFAGGVRGTASGFGKGKK